MKKERSFQRKLLPIILLLAAVPLFLFSILALVSLRSILIDRYQDQVDSDLDQTEKLLNITLDRYRDALVAAGTDEKFCLAVQKVLEGQEPEAESRGEVEELLGRICRQSTEAAGMTLVLENGDSFYYDVSAASGPEGGWMEEAMAACEGWKEDTDFSFCCPVPDEIQTGTGSIHIFGVFCRIVSPVDGEREGTLVVWLDEKVLRNTLAGEDGIRSFISDGDIVISATDPGDIGGKPEELSRGDYYVQSMIQEDTGWKITELYSLEMYHYTLFSQLAFEVLIAVAVMVILAVMAYLMSVPLVRSVRNIAGAMAAAREGDFSVWVEENPKSPYELNRIAEGFNDMAEQTGRLIVQLKQSAEEQKNAELQALEAQIDPHFLYNTLDTINWKAIEKNEMEISEMVGALADILRYSVINAGEESSIRSELYWLEQYVLLQQEKLGKEIKIKVEASERIQNMRIHKLLLQPFVENSIRYGFRGKEGECCLYIRMTCEDGFLHILLEDNGRGMDEETLDRLNDGTQTWSGHVGVENVRKRLRLYYSEQAYLHFESRQGESASVHIYVPIPEGEGDTYEDRDRGRRGGHP